MISDLREAALSTPAVVLQCGPDPLRPGTPGVTRSPGRLGVPVYGVHDGPWAPAASSRYLAGRVFWPPVTDQPERIHAGLLDLASHRWARGPSVPPRAAGGPRYRPGRAALGVRRQSPRQQSARRQKAGPQQVTASSVKVGENA